MILRRRVFSSTPRADFWAIIETFSQVKPGADDEVNGLMALAAVLICYRGTWRGAVMEWAWVVFSVTLEAVAAVVPMPVRVLVTDRRTTWRLQWLCWTFLWGMECPTQPSGDFLTTSQIAEFADTVSPATFRNDTPEGEQPVCAYCGTLTKQHAYTDLRSGSSYPPCCAECLDKWERLPKTEMKL